MNPASTSHGPSLLPPAWQIPASIRNRVGREAGPQRAMLEDGHLLLILHEVPEPEAVERTPAFFWRKPTGEWQARRNTMPSGSLTDFLKVMSFLLPDIFVESERLPAIASLAMPGHQCRSMGDNEIMAREMIHTRWSL